jgi:Flp pilus assembly protein TadG
MHGLMRRLNRDDGVIAFVIAIFAGAAVFITIAALVVDIGAMQLERRQLQNGAEAGALSAAYDCSFPNNPAYPCGATTSASVVASHNARDGATAVLTGDLCGAGSASLVSCTRPRTVRACPNTPTNAKWVQVTTSTLTSSGSNVLPQFFAQYVPGISPKTVTACAQAAWGPPAGNAATVFPMGLQWSCWLAQVGGSDQYGPATYSYAASTIWERYFKMSNGNNAGCLGSSDVSAGFGWLQISLTSCSNVSGSSYGYNSWMPIDTGNNMPTTCKNPLDPANPNTILYKSAVVPIYDCTWENGSWYGTRFPNGAACNTLAPPAGVSTGRYFHVAGYAPYMLTGYFYATSNQVYDGAMGAKLGSNCSGNDRCFFGWFTQQSLVSSGQIDDTVGYFGLNVVQLIG